MTASSACCRLAMTASLACLSCWPYSLRRFWALYTASPSCFFAACAGFGHSTRLPPSCFFVAA
eukprot:12601129-Prorocentrum_lima.AAC.1